ncbi:hypothetical protein [Azospirillum halopraeferens]|uniref:hypothetical protein n=1 Tax=Azospirillum halopraeferens TaxID=34010 RepID=UPI00048AB2B0|nr:hypothetical protein [Azospirillum halopraeferens]
MDAKVLVQRFVTDAGRDSERALSHLIRLRDAIADADVGQWDRRRRRCLHAVDDIIDTYRFYRPGERDHAQAMRALRATLDLYAEMTANALTGKPH